MQAIKYIYTWKDVDRIFRYFNRKNEYDFINDIDVYHDKVIISINNKSKKQDAQKILKDFLNKNYSIEKDCIIFDLFHTELEIIWEEDDASKVEKKVIPLFSDVIYRETSYEEKILRDNVFTDCPVIAFHSYKGGVGRTLSLISFMKAWSEFKPQKRLLIVDSDIEAPGLTWLSENDGDREDQFCYLDLLEMIQSSEMDDTKIEDIKEQMQFQKLVVDNKKTIVEHFFLPTYRYKEQLLDIYASPESIVKGFKKKYVLAEYISKLGKVLDCDAVLVDLRAGISEFSSPLLFDPRVKKYIVSSTSFQSIKGTQLILNEICKGLPITENSIIPNLLLTMTQSEIDIPKIKSELLQIYDEQEQAYTDNVLLELPFASELVHLESLQQILMKLEGRDFYLNMAEMINDSYPEPVNEPQSLKQSDRAEIIHAIHEIAENQITAETSGKFNVLVTKPISNLIARYNFSVPQAVVLGAKGAGKTFLFREILEAKKWEDFCSNKGGKPNENQTYILPIISPKNQANLVNVIRESISVFIQETDLASANCNYWFDNIDHLTAKLEDPHDLLEWKEIWKQCILNAIGDGWNQSLESLDSALKKKNCNILFIVDGLEEIFENTLENPSEKMAIRALVQDLMNEIRIQYSSIGLLVFLRKDLSNNSIETNRTQFEGPYQKYALNWTHDEALRLALWLVHQAVPDFYPENTVRIEDASKEFIKDQLNNLWGVKLGKSSSNEAYSSRWILAALSDFHSQLQARDIVRFLAMATTHVGNVTYSDRILMPKEIKEAVQHCSEAKVDEIKQEMKHLRPVFKKLEDAPDADKILPFSIGTFHLTSNEEQMMKQNGLLTVDDGKYYIPEIIRHSLKFKYEKGARPKVLSLLKIE